VPARITILPTEPIATINPNLYGHFAEHLGSCINCGVWVGEDSPIPNIGGLRADLVEAFRNINPPVLRWPGGCFADDYHWQDGLGPRNERAKTVNTWWGNTLEDNAFGTHEFITFCRLIGAQPYLAGNVGSGTVQEMRDWVEYCNFDQPSSLALQRSANGSPQPFNVKYWGVGNEAWGCGGNFCPADYARQYKRYATYLRDFGDTPLYLIACGPDGNNTDWTRSFFKTLGQPNPRWNARIHAFAAHYYAGTAGPSATDYSADQWYELLHKAAAVEQLILDQRAAMDEFDPHRQIDLIIDEWGTWHAPTPGRDPNHLWQQNTLRDALVAAITLNTFNRHADKLAMANLAQAVNVLQSLFLTEDEKLVLTPTYHVFDLYQHHQGGQSLRVEIGTDLISFAAEGEKHQLPALNASASISGDALTLSVTNADARRPAQALIQVEGHVLHGAEVDQTVLTADDIHAHNTFDGPEQVTPIDECLEIRDDWHHDFPPASVTVFRFRI
jgi:alpha-N-arabinofuranosidase